MTDLSSVAGTGAGHLRAARPADASALAALSIEVWLSTYLKGGIAAGFADYVLATFTPAALRDLLSDPAQVILVAQGAEGIEGYIRLTLADSTAAAPLREAELATLYVRPNCHRRGIGRALLAAGMARARQAGCAALSLMANVDNTAALDFYAAQGFEITGRRDFELDGVGYPNHLLRRRL